MPAETSLYVEIIHDPTPEQDYTHYCAALVYAGLDALLSADGQQSPARAGQDTVVFARARFHTPVENEPGPAPRVEVTSPSGVTTELNSDEVLLLVTHGLGVALTQGIEHEAQHGVSE